MSVAQPLATSVPSSPAGASFSAAYPATPRFLRAESTLGTPRAKPLHTHAHSHSRPQPRRAHSSSSTASSSSSSSASSSALSALSSASTTTTTSSSSFLPTRGPCPSLSPPFPFDSLPFLSPGPIVRIGPSANPRQVKAFFDFALTPSMLAPLGSGDGVAGSADGRHDTGCAARINILHGNTFISLFFSLGIVM
ncbi:hypothetical protein DACRYDRAFT_105064 [Dacryopinax primogenitus]|uniref:Uncharacterized protein n=1 Tax=Dacryopinax primogenitus (strain DJM 731) TaxID=1858805 RepID=M5GFA6_DACPD|nr:uncharacterized protein DACRYDRAFT_105064 [Dacryopinax primogenitus]EJU03993.1 hypothetical protein DACRYDRAFT_105064 [Dacryopinax primogenitus]